MSDQLCAERQEDSEARPELTGSPVMRALGVPCGCRARFYKMVRLNKEAAIAMCSGALEAGIQIEVIQ